jgi:hypothetical protein
VQILNKKIGIMVALLGFVLILVNAIEYIGGFFGFSIEMKSSMIIGIVLVFVGMVYSNQKNP